MPYITIADLPWVEMQSPGKKFHSFCRDISLALGGVRNAGPVYGGHPFDLQIRRVPPGAAICPFHSHFAQWELFIVRAGTGTARVGEEMHPIVTGDVFFHPPGVPHQVINTGATDLELLIVADNPALDACFYPDSKKWGLRPPGKFFRMAEAGYFDGEEEPVAGAPSFRVPAVPAGPTPAPFARRKIHTDELPWTACNSPKGKFRRDSKELSIALGAQRDTPSGLGGHPFEVELVKLAPGGCGCPFHCHAAQTEAFIIVEGSGTVRAGTERFAVHAGDAILHPPGEAHQLTNSGGSDLVFLIIADNPPVDISHYPDSGKWGHRPPQTFFRASDAEYWVGEE